MTIEALAAQLGETLKKRQWKLATAESCTGGGLAYFITNIPGSSAWFERGFITYSNQAKAEMLGVKEQTLAVFGAVSEPVAREMVEGALTNSKADIALAVTGIAGPSGGTAEKPVGTVWFSWTGINLATEATIEIFEGDRISVREQSILFGLEKLLNFIKV